MLDSDREKIRKELEQTKTLYKDCLAANKVFSSMNTELSEENKRMKYLIKSRESEINRLSEGFQMFYNVPFWKRVIYLFIGKIKGD